jgi:tetratricopeptide (TPR) repeat protein
MMFKGKPRFENLDQYVAQRDYALALEAIAEEIKRRPDAFNLLLRQAEILGLAGDRDKAISLYRKLAQHYAEQGFYARAIAVINKVLRLDPARQDVTVHRCPAGDRAGRAHQAAASDRRGRGRTARAGPAAAPAGRRSSSAAGREGAGGVALLCGVSSTSP